MEEYNKKLSGDKAGGRVEADRQKEMLAIAQQIMDGQVNGVLLIAEVRDTGTSTQINGLARIIKVNKSVLSELVIEHLELDSVDLTVAKFLKEYEDRN